MNQSCYYLGLISITDVCQNDCVFCGLGKHNKAAVHRPLEQIRNQIDKIYQSGVNRIAFTGGEPTIHPKIIDMVSYASSLGFEYIRIYTHGRNLPKRNLLEDLVSAGLSHIMISLFGPDEQTHNHVAGANAYKETLNGIIKASSSSLDIVINTPVTDANHKILPNYIDLLNDITHEQSIWQLSDLFPTTEVIKTPAVHAEYNELKKHLNIALTEATINKREFLLQEFPLCITFPWHANAKELGYWGKLTLLLGDEKDPDSIRKALPWVAPERFYHDDCHKCGYKKQCLGIPTSYYNHYADTSFVSPF